MRVMDLWDDKDEKLKKKRRKCAKNAAYAIGGGFGLFMVKFLIPDLENMDVEKVKELMNILSGWSVIYGIIVVGFLVKKPERALMINGLLVWMVTPVIVIYVVMQMASAMHG